MNVVSLPLGYLKANCYIINDMKKNACIIDPCGEADVIFDYLKIHDLNLKAILITHGHDDHIAALNDIIKKIDVPTYMNKNDIGVKTRKIGLPFVPPENAIFIEDKEIINVGDMHFKALYTPGHTKGSMCFLCENNLWTGDTLFKGNMGRVLNEEEYDTELKSLKKIYDLEGDYKVFPGHNDETLLSYERQFNPYMIRAKNI